MRRWIAFVILLGCAVTAWGQERCHIAADRSHYRAGETVHYAVTALDEGGISDQSSIAYVGLYAAEGLAASAKAELIEGRGGGELALPATLPTGNYLLLAWTKAGMCYDNARILSIYNPSTTRRSGAVTIAETLPEVPLTPAVGAEYTLRLDEAATVSVSLVRDNGLPEPSALENGGTVPGSPEVETFGEIVTLQIAGDQDYAGLEAFIAVPGSDQFYPATIEKDGTARFQTENLRGHQDVAFVIGKDEAVGNYTLTLQSPFPAAIGAEIPALTLAPAMRPSLATLGDTSLDTLDVTFPAHKSASLYGDIETHFSYILDDYNRFQTMRETLVEFVSDIRARRENGKTELRVRYREDVGGNFHFDKGRSLTLLDGVPVFQQQLLYDYDPALVERIDVYRGIYFLGNNYFSGIANFVTFGRDLPGFTFGGDVKILEFDGVSPVRAYSGGHETRYWHPMVPLEAGEPLHVVLPDAATGDFILTIEGFTASGQAIRVRARLSR